MNLFVSRNPPNDMGPGGSQRAMHLLQAVARHGPLDFLLLHREEDTESVTDKLDAVRPFVRSCERMVIDEWASPKVRWPKLPWKVGQVLEATLTGAIDAPRFSSRTLGMIKAKLPRDNYDLVFAARLSSACIVDSLIAKDYLSAKRKILDLDDLLSRFKKRELDLTRGQEGRLRGVIQSINAKRILDSEEHFVRTWDGVGLASADDASILSGIANTPVYTIPNVTGRPLLPPKAENGTTILFVGHLSYSPNVQGLTRFLLEVWPIIKKQKPDAILNIVGMRPNPDLVVLIQKSGANLFANVETLEPYYQDADVVIAPIWQGGGTRIKILESMAYGRPVVSTTVGAEGLGADAGTQLLLGDSSADFATAVLRILNDHGLASVLVENARSFQQENFSPRAVSAAIDKMISGYDARG